MVESEVFDWGNIDLDRVDQVTSWPEKAIGSEKPLVEESELPYSNTFEVPNYNLEFVEQKFRQEVIVRTNLLYTQQEVDWILQILEIAKERHINGERKETDKNGVPLPYVIHPIETALDAVLAGEDAVEVCICLLHDTREDTDLQDWQYLVLQDRFKGGHDDEGHTRRNGIRVEKGTYWLTNVTLGEPDGKNGGFLDRGEKLDDEKYIAKSEEAITEGEFGVVRAKGRDVKANLLSFGRLVENLDQEMADRITRYMVGAQTKILPLLEKLENDYRAKQLVIEIKEILKKLETRLKVAILLSENF